jgi:hypothetical protein
MKDVQATYALERENPELPKHEIFDNFFFAGFFALPVSNPAGQN